jgi:hypothetical protein
MLRTPLILGVALLGPAYAADEAPPVRDLPVISVCEVFRDLLSYTGKRVALRGELGRTSEGNWLVAEPSCPYRFKTDGFVWGQDLALSGNAALPKRVRALGPLGRTMPTTIITIVGIIKTREKYTVVCRFGELSSLGFGHLSGSPAELVSEVAFDPIVVERELRKTPAKQPCPPSPTEPRNHN